MVSAIMLEVDKRRGVLIVEADRTPLMFATVVLKLLFDVSSVSDLAKS